MNPAINPEELPTSKYRLVGEAFEVHLNFLKAPNNSVFLHKIIKYQG